MALNTIADLSTTAASNTDFLGTTTTGSGNASDIDAVRQNFAAIVARFYGDFGGQGTVGGSANAITLTSISTYQTLEGGLRVVFKAASANTTAATLNMDSLGAKAIRLQGDTALSGGEIKANGYHEIVYDTSYNSSAGAWVLMNPSTYVAGGTDVAVADGGTGASTAAAAVTNLTLATFFPGLLHGLTMSNGTDATNDIDIAAGVANDSTNVRVITLGSSITKRLDASWSVGTGNGGLDTGAIANTTYHIWLILRSDTGVVDALFSTSASSPTMPTNYDYKRRIGSIVRTGGSIKAFKQVGDDFAWVDPVQDISANNPGTSAVSATLTVPTGIAVKAKVIAGLFDDSSTTILLMLVTALNQTDTACSTSMFSVMAGNSGTDAACGAEINVETDTSARVRYRLGVSNTDITAYINTMGWTDRRGRVA